MADILKFSGGGRRKTKDLMPLGDEILQFKPRDYTPPTTKSTAEVNPLSFEQAKKVRDGKIFLNDLVEKHGLEHTIHIISTARLKSEIPCENYDALHGISLKSRIFERAEKVRDEKNMRDWTQTQVIGVLRDTTPEKIEKKSGIPSGGTHTILCK